MNTISVKHSGPSGDIIYSLPAIREFAAKNGPVTYYLRTDANGFDFGPNNIHPDGGVLLTKNRAEAMIPLLESQPYIKEAKIWTGERIVLDLDGWRFHKTAAPNGYLARWYFHLWGELTADLSEQTIYLSEKEEVGPILVNRTSRYRNPEISYKFLQHRPEKINFIGSLAELDSFRRDVPKANYIETPTCLDAAIEIQKHQVFLGNQSMCFGIAEMLKKPRILELCPGEMGNVIPTGKKAYDFLTQQNFEAIVSLLLD